MEHYVIHLKRNEYLALFEKPLTISTQNTKNKVRVTFNDTTLIFDFFGREIKNDTHLEYDIPP